MSKNSYLRKCCAQISKIVFPVDLTVLRLITTIWAKMSQISYFRSHKITNRVLSLIDRFSAYYNCMNKNVTKLISPRILCTVITSRVFSWFDHFTAYYNCLSKNVTNLISSRVLCTSITNRVFSWFERFTAYYNCMSKNVKKLIFAQGLLLCKGFKKVFLSDLKVLRFITTVWVKLSQDSYLCEFWHKYHKSCF